MLSTVIHHVQLGTQRPRMEAPRDYRRASIGAGSLFSPASWAARDRHDYDAFDKLRDDRQIIGFSMRARSTLSWNFFSCFDFKRHGTMDLCI